MTFECFEKELPIRRLVTQFLSTRKSYGYPDRNLLQSPSLRDMLACPIGWGRHGVGYCWVLLHSYNCRRWIMGKKTGSSLVLWGVCGFFIDLSMYLFCLLIPFVGNKYSSKISWISLRWELIETLLWIARLSKYRSYSIHSSVCRKFIIPTDVGVLVQTITILEFFRNWRSSSSLTSSKMVILKW